MRITAHQYEYARTGTAEMVVVEGAHALKHAVRFGAQFVDVRTDDKAAAIALMRRIATDADADAVAQLAQEVDKTTFRACATPAVRTGLVALAVKPREDRAAMCGVDAPIVAIEDARDINNVGAVVRVAAAWGVAGVVYCGTTSPWHVAAIRAGAGLQWAVPIAHVASLEGVCEDRVVYACDADGVSMETMQLQRRSIVVFGTERDGLTPQTKARADALVAIPMQRGVSSMNLATSVAAFLYGNPHLTGVKK